MSKKTTVVLPLILMMVVVGPVQDHAVIPAEVVVEVVGVVDLQPTLQCNDQATLVHGPALKWKSPREMVQLAQSLTCSHL